MGEIKRWEIAGRFLWDTSVPFRVTTYAPVAEGRVVVLAEDCDRVESERDAFARRQKELEDDIKEVLARAWAFDDKPHLLFSGVAALAKKHIEEPEYGREIVRLMDDAYENIRLWKQSALPVRD